ncbi:hypothetical protein BHE74_00049598 [Ensete ventricosum]|nr:hypothetical protein BHE74_00049598 [Ensete ventricosum]
MLSRGQALGLVAEVHGSTTSPSLRAPLCRGVGLWFSCQGAQLGSMLAWPRYNPLIFTLRCISQELVSSAKVQPLSLLAMVHGSGAWYRAIKVRAVEMLLEL